MESATISSFILILPSVPSTPLLLENSIENTIPLMNGRKIVIGFCVYCGARPERCQPQTENVCMYEYMLVEEHGFPSQQVPI